MSIRSKAFKSNGKKEKSSSRRKDGRKRGGGVSQVCTAVKFPRSSSVREVEKSILPVCSTAEQEFSPFYCHAHTRLVSNDLTSEEGGEERIVARTRQKLATAFLPAWRSYEKREERKVETFTGSDGGEATPEVISCRLFTSRPSILLCKYYYWPSRTPFQWKIDARNLVLRD